MSEKVVILVGGNSEIGGALAKGIAARYGHLKIIRISRIDSIIVFDNSLRVKSYENFNKESFLANHDIVAIVIAFGILESEGNYLSNLEKNFQVNVFQYLKTCENAIKYILNNPNTELHITSSILADFSRESIFAYSQSKSVMEESLMHMHRALTVEKPKLFVWKPAFVDTKLNARRKKSIISTDLKSIERAATRIKDPGINYLPKYAKFPARILRHFPRLAAKLG